jgi:hypothetical protein
MSLGIITGFFSGLVKPVADHFKRKQELVAAVHKRKLEMASSQQDHNQAWELKQLDNAGWKDDILFYAFLVMFIWAGFDPEGAGQFFTNLQVLPEWAVQTWFWLVASVLGVKKIGDLAPSAIGGIKAAFKGGHDIIKDVESAVVPAWQKKCEKCGKTIPVAAGVCIHCDHIQKNI